MTSNSSRSPLICLLTLAQAPLSSPVAKPRHQPLPVFCTFPSTQLALQVATITNKSSSNDLLCFSTAVIRSSCFSINLPTLVSQFAGSLRKRTQFAQSQSIAVQSISVPISFCLWVTKISTSSLDQKEASNSNVL
jgi:hypothetical protein